MDPYGLAMVHTTVMNARDPEIRIAFGKRMRAMYPSTEALDLNNYFGDDGGRIKLAKGTYERELHSS